MALEYPGEWKFEGIDVCIPQEAISEFYNLILKIASGSSNRWGMIESFKAFFGRSGYSSSESWAESDLISEMSEYAENAALFIDALWSGIQEVESVESKVIVPSHTHINNILTKYDVPLEINPPQLIMKRGDISVVSSDSETAYSDESNHVYHRGAEIGRGGFGIVYRVTRKTSVANFEFAMKVHDPSPFIKNKERSFERFRREINILKQIQHRAIVSYMDAGVDQNGKPYVLMPLIEGSNLREAVQGCEVGQVLQMFVEILLGLKYAYSRNIIHRDLKPSNVLVRDSDKQPIIVDFGCAYLLDERNETSLTTTHIGSLGYIPPEVISNPKLRSPLQDIFACGVMLYEVFADMRPNPTDYTPLSNVSEKLGVLDPIVRDAIAPAKNRIESASEFLSRIRRVLAMNIDHAAPITTESLPASASNVW